MRATAPSSASPLLRPHLPPWLVIAMACLASFMVVMDGSIVNVASVAAFVAQRNNAPYGAAKAAIAGFSRQLALEVGPEIRVNVVAPGRTQTGMTEPLV